MRSKKRLLFLGLLLIGITFYISCRKIDKMSQEKTAYISVEDKFFDSHKSSNPQVIAINSYLKKENEKYHFVDKIIAAVGNPIWDKSIISKPVITGHRGTTEDSTTYIYIPFARDSEAAVNATLIFKTDPNDTAYKWICDWQYKTFSHGNVSDTSTAESIAAYFMMFDHRVFSDSLFKITDSNLFANAPELWENGLRQVKITNGSGKNAKPQTLGQLICVNIYWCGDPAYCSNRIGGCDYLNCIAPPTCYFIAEICYCDGGGDCTTNGTGQGNNGGSWNSNTTYSGGGGNGSAYVPPSCNGGYSRTFVQDCTNGWVSSGGGTGPPNPTEPIDSMLARYSRGINGHADTLMTRSLDSNWEYSSVIVSINNSIYLKNDTTAKDSLSTIVKWVHLPPGSTVLGYIHFHPSLSSNVKDRSAPSGSDLDYLGDHLANRFVEFVECGNIRYALVIEDAAKATIFFSNLNRRDLNLQLTVNAQQISNWLSDWQGATETALKDLIGSASTCGIGFYKATDTDRANFQKINP